MKWLAFTLALVAGFVGLGIWSVMPPGVVWEERTPLCSRCRAAVRPYSHQCPTCDRSLRWTSTDEECRWCLSKEDARLLRDSYLALEIDEGAHMGLLRQFPRAYFESIEPGDCTYCAGLGRVMRGEAEVTCMVCRGGKACIACDGDREVVIGDEGAHSALLARLLAHRQARQRSDLTGLPVRRSMVVDEDVEALKGYREAEALTESGLPERAAWELQEILPVADGDGAPNDGDAKPPEEPLLKLARARATLAFRALEKARQEKVEAPAAD